MPATSAKTKTKPRKSSTSDADRKTSRQKRSSVPQRRAVVIAGSRTPFVRAFKEFTTMDAIALGDAAVGALLKKTSLPRRELDALVWSGVILPSAAPNVGREIVLDLKLPHAVEATTVTMACASGLRAITTAAAMIERGDADVVIAGGADSTSNAEIKLPQKLVHTVAPVAMSGKATARDWLQVVAQLAPFTDIVPKRPKIAERTTGQVMGEAAEHMAERNGITRQAQDHFAVQSHHRAASAIADGVFVDEIVSVETPQGQSVYADTIVRGDTSEEALSRLRPVFKKGGTLTAGNSSALTDGAAAVLLMNEEKAKAMGFRPLAAFRSWSYVGVDPADQLLMGPALAMPAALERAGMTLSDVDLVDMHEAFAAQVLSVLKMLGSDAFAQQRLGRTKAVGDIGSDRLNVYGGSVALGHPFAATGARMTTTMARALHARDASFALLGICAAGGLGAAAVLERI